MARSGPTATRPAPGPTTFPDAWLGRLRSDRWLGARGGAEGGACAVGLGGCVEKREARRVRGGPAEQNCWRLAPLVVGRKERGRQSRLPLFFRTWVADKD